MASWARPIRDGEYTSVIYGLIREGRLIEAASALADCSRRQGALGSRAALSLLAFCHYQAQEFEQAASCYEQLCTLCPEEPRYALSRAQALYQSGQAYDEALQVAAALAEDKPEMAPAARQLQAAIRYAQEPPEAFGNLLLLCCRLEQHPLAADLLAEHAALTYRLLPPFLYEFLEALLAQQTAPEEAYAKLEALAARQADRLRQMRQQGAPQAQCEAVLRERFLPALMAQARIPWEAHDYPLVERLFRRSVELCSEEDCWRLNVGHVLFVQEGKFHEAVAFYEPLVERQQDRDLLRLRPALLANLCVAYIMTGQNEQAEQLMRRVEQREEQLAYDQPGEKIFHLCIVNLVIGTLYCAKGNYDFGISRVIKSFEPHASKLGADTWYYAKRCLLALFESLAKQVVLVRDAVLYDLLKFLEQCEQHGRTLPSATDIRPTPAGLGSRSVAYEARRLRALTLRLMAAEPNAFRNR